MELNAIQNYQLKKKKKSILVFHNRTTISWWLIEGTRWEEDITTLQSSKWSAVVYKKFYLKTQLKKKQITW